MAEEGRARVIDEAVDLVVYEVKLEDSGEVRAEIAGVINRLVASSGVDAMSAARHLSNTLQLLGRGTGNSN